MPPGYLNFITRIPSNGTTLQRCEADCDNDDECAGTLRCFQRGSAAPLAPVPGCCGLGSGGSDYCYDPDDEQLPPEPTLGPTQAPTESAVVGPTKSTVATPVPLR